MDKRKLIEKLTVKTNVSYEKAESTLEKCGWNILDAVLELEDEGEISKPEMGIYYTNKSYRKVEKNEIVELKTKEEKRSNYFQDFIAVICDLIDKGNNIFFQIARCKKVLIKLPVTVIILLLAFTFWFTVPLLIIGFFFDIEYSFAGRGAENNVINKVLKKVSDEIKKMKRGRRDD